MITDYGSLQTAVASRANRSDLTADIPDFIRRAHDVIVGEVVMAADLTISTQSTALPTGFREALSVWLVNRPMKQLSEASEQVTQYISGAGIPYCFRIDTTLLVYPTPMSSYVARMVYRLSRTFFADDTATNAVLTRYPFVYLYGAMAELQRHLLDDNQADRYELLFRAEIERINAVEVGDATRGALQLTSVAP